MARGGPSGAELCEGHYDASIAENHEALDAGFRTLGTYAKLAAALAFEGKMEEAKATLVDARGLDPNLTVKRVMALRGVPTPIAPVVLEGLRKAGLPEE